MSIRKGLSRAFGGMGQERKGLSGGTLTLDNPVGWMTGEDHSLSTEAAMKVSTVNRCVELRSNTVANLPVYLMREATKERIHNHRLGLLLWERPNEAMTRFDYEKLMQVNCDLRGNAYAWIYRSPATGYPMELIPLVSDYVVPRMVEGRLWYFYINPEGGGITRLPPADVLHYKAFSYDGIAGVSILARAAQTVRTAQSASRFEQSMYDNGGRPSGVLTTDADIGGDVVIHGPDGEPKTISKKEFLRGEWARIHNGPGNAFRVAVLDNGLKYQAISMSQSDAQFVESAELRVADICRFFGVPPHLVFAGKQSYQSNEQNSLEYVKYTMLAEVTQKEQEDSYKLLLPSEREGSLRIKRELKVYLRGDTAAQAAWYKALREVGGYCVNDIRSSEDMGVVPGGDEHYASWNYGPLSQWAELSVLRAMGKAGVPIEEE